MKYKFAILAVLFLGTITLTGAGCSQIQKNAALKQTEDKMAEQKTMADNENKKVESEKIVTDKNETNNAMMDKKIAGIYTDYSAEALQKATANNGKAVLFFWAAWCPNCKAANADFTAHTDQIPEGVTILKTNYDTEKMLKTKYGVTYQHTFVQIDAQGNAITKWSGGGIADLIKNLK